MAAETETGAGSRRAARRAALQALYQWQFTGAGVDELMAQFRGSGRLGRADTDYFDALVRGAIDAAAALETVYAEYLDRAPEQLDPVERAILLLGTYELAERPDVPHRVVINEALELAKAFGATEGYRFINGVLDKVWKSRSANERE